MSGDDTQWIEDFLDDECYVEVVEMGASGESRVVLEEMHAYSVTLTFEHDPEQKKLTIEMERYPRDGDGDSHGKDASEELGGGET